MTTHQGPRWVGSDPPEPIDVEMMGRYSRTVIEETARPRRGPIPWACVGFIVLSVFIAFGQWQGWAR